MDTPHPPQGSCGLQPGMDSPRPASEIDYLKMTSEWRQKLNSYSALCSSHRKDLICEGGKVTIRLDKRVVVPKRVHALPALKAFVPAALETVVHMYSLFLS